MFHKLLLRLSVNFMAVLMIVLLVLGALVSRFMWINELNTGVEEMKREAEDIARNYEDLSDYQITTRVFVSCINEIALDSSVWLVDRNGLQLNVTDWMLPRRTLRARTCRSTCRSCSRAASP